MLSLDSNDHGQGLFQEIVDSTLRWQAGMPGVYPVRETAREKLVRTRTAELPALRATEKREFPVIVRFGRLYTPYELLILAPRMAPS